MKFGAREVLFLLVMLGLLGSAWFFVFKRADESIAAYAADTASKEQKLREVREATVRIADMNKRLESLQQLIRMFEGKLPRASELGAIVRQVDQQARKSRLLEVGSIKAPSAPEKAAGYFELPVRISMRGDFKSFYDFLLQIERMTRITRINQMKLTKINEVDGSMSADMTLSIYFAPDNAAK